MQEYSGFQPLPKNSETLSLNCETLSLFILYAGVWWHFCQKANGKKKNEAAGIRCTPVHK